jgi:hypothetical protein
VRVHSLTISYTPRSMKCDSHVSLLAHTLASLCLNHEPKARVAKLLNYHTKTLGLIITYVCHANHSNHLNLIDGIMNRYQFNHNWRCVWICCLYFSFRSPLAKTTFTWYLKFCTHEMMQGTKYALVDHNQHRAFSTQICPMQLS